MHSGHQDIHMHGFHPSSLPAPLPGFYEGQNDLRGAVSPEGPDVAGDGAGIDVLADMVRRLQEGTGGGGMEGQRHEGGCASCAERDGWRTMGQSSAYLALPNTCIRMQIRPPHTLTHSPTLLPRSPHYSPPDTRGLCLLLGSFFVPELCSVLKNPTPHTSPHLTLPHTCGPCFLLGSFLVPEPLSAQMPTMSVTASTPRAAGIRRT